MQRPVVIVGAGIAGLTAAIALARAGFPVRLFERAPSIEAVGAGIQLSPNALRVLDRLGLLAILRARAVASDHVALRSGRSGRILAQVPVSSADATGYLALHRADLQDVLVKAAQAEPGIRVALGHTLHRLDTGTDETALVFARADGTHAEERAALLIGADGVHSRVASELGLAPATQTGIEATRFVAPAQAGGTPARIEAWLGPRRHAVAYPMRGGALVNVVLVGPDAAKEPARPADSFRRWDPDLNALLARARFEGRWPLLETDRPLVPVPRICLIGDAAHAMLPFAAQGAAMAIEDGFVLAHHLRGTNGSERSAALQDVADARSARLDAVRRRVAFHRFTYHLPFPFSLGRDLTLARRPAAALRRDLAWLYDWSPPGEAALPKP